MESKKVESNAELTPFEKEFKVQLNLPAVYFILCNLCGVYDCFG